MTRMLEGVVVSDKMNKTRVVAVAWLKKHPKYHKYYRQTSKFKAHDEKGEYHVGDRVAIESIRPMSKEKKFRVVGKAS